MILSDIPTTELIAELKRRRSSIDASLAPYQHLSSASRMAVDAVKQAVCKEWGITMEMLLSPGRPKIVTDPRQAAMEIMRNHLFLTYEAVGEVFGKDHGTVIHACETHASRMTDPNFKRRYRAALTTIKRQSLEAAGFVISAS